MPESGMDRITPDRRWPLNDTAASRGIERAAAAALPPHTLMQRAGLAVARLTLALAPGAHRIWIACGPGNNGGDGMEAALHLKQAGREPLITWAGEPSKAPADARASLARARDAGVTFAQAAPQEWDFAIDAMLGLGSTRPLEGAMALWSQAMSARPADVLAIDLPSGLDSDTGSGNAVRASHTLCLLTLKPGLFTGHGRDAAGEVWFDDLGVTGSADAPTAWLSGAPAPASRLHATHKGSYGDVAVIGGAPGMTGAALLAASAALHGGAGRVFVGLLDGGSLSVDTMQPELMFRAPESLALDAMTVACGCGGGDAVRTVLPRVLSTAAQLVLDADALNAIAADTQLQVQLRARGARNKPSVITPHPLEAARLLGCSSAQVQGDRLHAARELAQRFACICVLKGSGTIIAAPSGAPMVNPTGNALLATAGTGDVLAGLIAARLAHQPTEVMEAAASAVYVHGLAADQWPANHALTASALARALQ